MIINTHWCKIGSDMHRVLSNSVLESNIYESNKFIEMYHIIEFCPNVSFCAIIFLNLRLLHFHAVVTLPIKASPIGNCSL